MIVVKYGSEAWALQKADEDLLDVFHRNCLRIVLGTRLIDRISTRRRYEKFGPIPLFMATKREDCPFQPTQWLNGNQSSAVRMGGCYEERFKGNGNFLGGCKEGDFE